MVLLQDGNRSPIQWNLDQGIEIHSRRSSVPRVASVTTLKGIVKRPVMKLCVLSIDNDSASL
jgi:hypothetical protein